MACLESEGGAGTERRRRKTPFRAGRGDGTWDAELVRGDAGRAGGRRSGPPRGHGEVSAALPPRRPRREARRPGHGCVRGPGRRGWACAGPRRRQGRAGGRRWRGCVGGSNAPLRDAAFGKNWTRGATSSSTV